MKAVRPFLLVLLVMSTTFARADRPTPDGYTAGTPWTGAAGITERTSDIMERSNRGRKTGQLIRVHKLGTVEHVEYVSPVQPVPPTSGPLIAGPGSTAQTVTNAFLGATLADTLAYPPDTMGAAGPAQFIVAVNGRIRSFNKTTGIADGAINADTDAFFASVMTPTSVNFTSDPRIRYDRLSQRWFIIMLDVPNGTGATPNRIMLAVSDGPVITGGSVWTFYQFQHDQVSPTGDTGKFADYPTLGIDANALYIGVNIFGTRGTGAFANTTAFVVRKSSLLGGGPIVVTAFRKLISNGPSSGAYTPQGVDNFDPAATEGYIIGVDGNYYGKLQLRRVSDPGGTPSISSTIAITLPVINGSTINVPHLGNTGGTAGNLDGLDYRLLAAHFRNGRLWTTANLAVDNTGASSAAGATVTRMGVRWYELDGIPTGQTPGVVQSGTLFDPSPSTTTNRNFWMGSAMVSGQGHVAMGFSVAGPSEYVNAGTCGRLKNDAAGTMRSPVLYTASSSAYNPRDGSGNPIERWGDYSYTCLDPNDDMTMWTIQEFCVSPNYYGVQIAKLLAPPPATPASCNPASLNQGTNNATVTLIGSSDGDTGFFDPGAGFSNRIAAAVAGTGVTVNSLTYNNPTNIALNLSVAAGATTGSRTVTVTNPDGQSVASSGGILAINSAVTTNHPPALPGIANKTVIEGNLLTFTNTATDPDGNALTYSLAGAPVGASVTNNGVFMWTPNESQGPNTNLMAMLVTDNGSPSLSVTQSFTVFVLEANASPVLPAIADKTVVEGQMLTFTNTATDPDLPANSLSYSLIGAPVGASITNGGVFAWTPSESQGPGTNQIFVIVTDNGSPSLSTTQTFTVFVLETNSAPVLPAIADKTVIEGQLLTFTNTATDPDLPANSLSYSLIGAPVGASITNGGVFAWTPNESQGPGTNQIFMIATDNGSPSLSTTQTFTVFVLETNSAPALPAIADRTLHATTPLVITNSATDSDLPANTLTYTLDSGAPATASINTSNGVFQWTPADTDAGTTNTITVRVTDDGTPPLDAVQTFQVIIVERPIIGSISISNDIVTVGWNAINAATYRLQYTPLLELPAWLDVPGDVTAAGPTASKTDPDPVTTNRFYRVQVLP